MTTLTPTERTAKYFNLLDTVYSLNEKMQSIYSLPESLCFDDLDMEIPTTDLSPFLDADFRHAVEIWLCEQPVDISKTFTVLMLNVFRQVDEDMSVAYAGSLVGFGAFIWQQFDLGLKFSAISTTIAKQNDDVCELADTIISSTLMLYGFAEDGEDLVAQVREQFLSKKDEIWDRAFTIDFNEMGF